MTDEFEEAVDEDDATGSAPTGELPPGLYVVATPIGNLGDITHRAAKVLASVDRILCEDARITVRLLRHLGIERPLSPYHEHNADKMRPRVLAMLERGESLALVSDAGTPLLSDPGFKLVTAAIEREVLVVPIPGPSALLAGLVLAGLPTDRFFFQGFLPAKAGPRRAVLAELLPIPATLVIYEAPHRIVETVEDALLVLGDRPAAITRELTKRFEEARRGSLASLAEKLRAEGPPRGEIVLVIGRGDPKLASVDDATLAEAYAEAATLLSPRKAAQEVAARFGLDANEVYRRVARKDAGG